MQTFTDIQGKIQVDTLILDADSIVANLLDRVKLSSTSKERLTENEYVILSVIHFRQNLIKISQNIPELNEQIAEISELIVELYTKPSVDSSVTLMDLESAISKHIAQLQQYDSRELDGIVNRFCLELSAWKNVIYPRMNEDGFEPEKTIAVSTYEPLSADTINTIQSLEEIKEVLTVRFKLLSDFLYARKYTKPFAFLPLEFSGAIAVFNDIEVLDTLKFIAHIKMFLIPNRIGLNPLVQEAFVEFLTELESFETRFRRIYLTTET